MRRSCKTAAPLAARLLGLASAALAEGADPQRRVDPGRKLFYNADLSFTGTMACVTCHEQWHGFTDNNRGHPGIYDDPAERNVPGLANIGQFRNLTWAEATGQPLPSAAAEEGRKLFAEKGRATCHAPPLFSDDAFHKVTALKEGETDAGLGDVTGEPEDRGLFRTPSLRNAAMTFPYWHDGRVETLTEAMALHDPGLTGQPKPTRSETAALIASLGTLTDT